MDGDMNDIFQKINSIMSDKETADNLKNIIDNFNTSSQDKSQTSEDNSEHSSNNDFPNFDIDTFLRLKKIMDGMNSSKNDSRTNLLLSLKPYLTDSKKEKIDQYIRFLKIASVVESMNFTGGDEKNE